MGINLRFFSEKVFGAWVDGRVIGIGSKWITLDTSFYGARWVEKIPKTREVYRPYNHPEAGEAFLVGH